ncbi:MAG TPA: hypothetical protein VF609_04400 [Flavisolibacter sp.]
MLLVFLTISFIPRNYFHDVIADHRDTVTCDHPVQEGPCVHQKGFNCSFTDLVVTTPYVSNITVFHCVQPVHHATGTCGYLPLVLPQLHLHTESRGPPSIAVA